MIHHSESDKAAQVVGVSYHGTFWAGLRSLGSSMVSPSVQEASCTKRAEVKARTLKECFASGKFPNVKVDSSFKC